MFLHHPVSILQTSCNIPFWQITPTPICFQYEVGILRDWKITFSICTNASYGFNVQSISTNCTFELGWNSGIEGREKETRMNENAQVNIPKSNVNDMIFNFYAKRPTRHTVNFLENSNNSAWFVKRSMSSRTDLMFYCPSQCYNNILTLALDQSCDVDISVEWSEKGKVKFRVKSSPRNDLQDLNSPLHRLGTYNHNY